MANDPLQKLFDLIARLRGDDGCPWDRAQSAEDIISDLVEEVYEMQWAHASQSPAEVLDETGDVLFVFVFAVALLSEQYPEITLQNLANHAYEKIYRRHPHVFGDAVARTREEGLAHWESMKAEERAGEAHTEVFGDVPPNLPPMRRAEKIQKRAARAGFDWSDAKDIVAKVREELAEIEPLLADKPKAALEEEIGDLFFSIINLARFLHVDGDKALAAANAKFVSRYRRMKNLAESDGLVFEDLDITAMERYWQRAKS